MLSRPFKKLITLFLVGTQLSYPVLATADTYGYRASVQNLKVTDVSGGSSGSGSGAPAAVLTATPSNQSFGSIVIGQSSSPQTVLFTNTGNLPAQTGTASASAEYSVSNGCNSVTLAPGQACSVQVTFSPVSVKNFAPGSVTLPYSFSGATGNPAALASFTAIGAPEPIQYAPRLTVSAASVDFGNVLLGESTSRQVTLSNTGNLTANLSYSDLPSSISGGGTCTTELAPNTSCSLELLFTPSSAVVTSGVLLINANNGASFASVALTGHGADTYYFETSSTALSFVAGDLNTKSVNVLNTGTGTLTSALVTIEGTGLSASHNCATVLPETTCTITVSRVTTSPGTVQGALHISFAGSSQHDVPVASVTSGSVFVVTPNTTQDFGTVNVGSSSSSLNYLISNVGNVAANLMVSTPAEASVTLGGTCSGVLAAGATCQLVLEFTPTAHGAVAGVISVEDAQTEQDFSGSVVLSYAGFGQGVPLLQANLSDGNVFSPSAVGQSVSKTITVTNTGTLGLTGLSLAKTGSSAFVLNNNCAETLAPGASCDAEVAFTAQAVGQDSATLAVTTANGPSTTFNIYGTGQAAILTADSTVQAFAGVAIGSTSSRTTTITNSGNIAASLNFSAVSAPFSRAGTCTTSLPAGASCTVVLTYAPTDTSTSSGALTVSALNTSATVSYSGTGQANPSFSVSASSLSLGTVAIPQTGSQTVTVTNTGNVPLTTSNISVSGNGLSRTTTCSGTLAVGASCTATVTLTPVAAEVYTGALSISFTEVPAQNVVIEGIGYFSQSFAISHSAIDYGTVAVGASSSQVVSLINMGSTAIAGPITLDGPDFIAPSNVTCGAGLAPGAVCSFTLTFNPTAVQGYSSNVYVSFPSTEKKTILVTGTGGQVSGQLNGVQTTDFGGVTIGQSKTLSFTYQNLGTVAATGVYASVAGTGLSLSANTCGTSGAGITVGAGQSCSVNVTYAPTATSTLSGTLSVNDGTAVKTLTLSGSGNTSDPYSSSVTLLLHGEGANGSTTFTDASAYAKTVTPYGAAQISTTQAKVGTGSLYFPGTGSYSSLGSPVTFGTFDFTVESWVRFTSVGSFQRILSTTAGPFNAGTFNLRLNADNRFYTLAGGSAGITSTVTAVPNTWYHLAVSRNSGVSRFYVNGVLQGSESSPNAITEPLSYMGGYYTVGNSEYLSGYLDEVRVTTGVGRYLTAFTPATTAYTLDTISLSATSVDMGNVAPSSSVTKSVVVTNTSSASFSSPSISVSGAAFTSSHNCTTVPLNSSCTVNVTLTHNGAFSYSGNLSIAFNGITAQAIPLTGTGTKVLVLDANSARTWSDGTVAASCKSYKDPAAGYAYAGVTGNGVYKIDVDGVGSLPVVSVYCDMTTDGGGWTVVQKRTTGAVDFYRNYADYTNGFGSAAGEYWLGNKYLNALTSVSSSLRIDVSRTNGQTGYANYSSFSVGSPASGYVLGIGGYSGNIGDSMVAMGAHQGQRFSTFDVDQDSYPAGNCAATYRGAWWYNACHASNLNGAYLNGPHASYADGIEWYTWTGHNESLKTSEMKVRAN